jgi:pilus assembly protein CpaB
VDVLGTFTVPGNSGPVTQTILQNVEVLTAGEKTEPDPTGKPQTVTVVTFLLSPEDSQKLLMASTQGTLQFVLRNGADQAKAEVAPTSLAELTGGAKPPQPARAPEHQSLRRASTKRLTQAAAPPSTIVVEVIQGQTRKEEKFSETPKEGSDKKQ